MAGHPGGARGRPRHTVDAGKCSLRLGLVLVLVLVLGFGLGLVLGLVLVLGFGRHHQHVVGVRDVSLQHALD